MSIRRIMLLSLIFIVIISIAINGFILASLTDRYFQTYLADVYEERIEQAIEYIRLSLTEGNHSYERMTMELESYITDPITQLRLFDSQGNVLVDVYDGSPMARGHMGRGMMGHMRGSDADNIENYEIVVDGEVIAYLAVYSNNSIANSMVARQFKSSLLNNSIFSMVIALIISVLVGYAISRKMSGALKDTAEYAKAIEFQKRKDIKDSNIIEVRQIRESLDELSTRLSLKQEGRKELIDQLIHQTRTPLTIIRTHVEALEDGVIEGSPEEMEVIYNEVDNISSIISNLGGMIDAQKERDELVLEKVELSSLIRQIVAGLKSQFDKKGLALNISSNKNLSIITDRYKLSQILYNILTNAYKYTKEGRVDINCRVDENNVYIDIEDTGIGISEEDRKKVFDAYYRSPNASKVQGDGIGLYLVTENIRQLKGQVLLESQLGRGSKFTIVLPKNEKSS